MYIQRLVLGGVGVYLGISAIGCLFALRMIMKRLAPYTTITARIQYLKSHLLIPLSSVFGLILLNIVLVTLLNFYHIF